MSPNRSRRRVKSSWPSMRSRSIGARRSCSSVLQPIGDPAKIVVGRVVRAAADSSGHQSPHALSGIRRGGRVGGARRGSSKSSRANSGRHERDDRGSAAACRSHGSAVAARGGRARRTTHPFGAARTTRVVWSGGPNAGDNRLFRVLQRASTGDDPPLRLHRQRRLGRGRSRDARPAGEHRPPPSGDWDRQLVVATRPTNRRFARTPNTRQVNSNN